MILNQLINPKPKIIILFVVFCILIACTPLISANLSVVYYNNFFPAFVIFILSLLLPSFHAVGLNNMVYEKNIIKKDNLVLGFTYLMLSAPFYNCLKSWVISFFILFYINYLFDSYQKDYPLSQTFNAAFILSVLSFFDSNMLLFSLLIIISGINYENITWRVFLNIMIGLALPYFFFYTYSQITQTNFLIPNIEFKSTQIPNYKNWNEVKLYWFLVVFFISLLSFLELFNWLYKKSIRSRKSFIIILFYFILTLIIGVYGDGVSSWYYLISPLAIIVGNYFTYTKNRKIANVLFITLIISSIYYRYVIAI